MWMRCGFMGCPRPYVYEPTSPEGSCSVRCACILRVTYCRSSTRLCATFRWCTATSQRALAPYADEHTAHAQSYPSRHFGAWQDVCHLDEASLFTPITPSATVCGIQVPGVALTHCGHVSQRCRRHSAGGPEDPPGRRSLRVRTKTPRTAVWEVQPCGDGDQGLSEQREPVLRISGRVRPEDLHCCHRIRKSNNFFLPPTPHCLLFFAVALFFEAPMKPVPFSLLVASTLSEFWLGRHAAYAMHNVTVDDSSSLIKYDGPWVVSAPSALDYNNTHQYSLDHGAKATFTFTGVAIYYMGPLWPYDVTTTLSLDKGPPVVVNMQDLSAPPTPFTGPETVQSQAIWGMAGLTNTQHTLVASMGTSGEVEMDGLIYTVLDPADLVPSPSPSKSPTATRSGHPTGKPSATHTPSPSPSPTSSSSKKHTAVAVVGSLCGLGLVAALLSAAFMVYRKRRRSSNIRQIPSSLHLPNSSDIPAQPTMDMGQASAQPDGYVAPFMAGHPYGFPNAHQGTAEHQPQPPVPYATYAQPVQNYNSASAPYGHPTAVSSGSQMPFAPVFDQNHGLHPSVHSAMDAPLPNPFDWNHSPSVSVGPPVHVPTHDPYQNYNPSQSGHSITNDNHNANWYDHGPAADVNIDTHRLSTASGRESVAGLAYLACTEPDAEVEPTLAPSRARILTVVNGEDTASSSDTTFGQKLDQTHVPTSRQEDGSGPPPPAYS